MNEDDVRYKELIEHITDGLYIVDRSRRILSWNHGAEAITGFSREQVIGCHCFDNILRHIDAQGTSLCQNDCPLVKTMADGKPREDLIYLHHRDGHRVPVQVRTSPVRDQRDTIVGAVEVFYDATPTHALADQLEELKQAALTDPLTALPNRRYLEMSLASRLNEVHLAGRGLGVLIMDIDRFKDVNDRYGHAVGDEVLNMVSRTLRHGARSTDDVGRWGGEEFVVLTRCDAEQLREIGDRFRTLVAESHLRDHDPPLGVTLSIGGAIAELTDTPESLLRRADERLYAAKAAGRNQVLLSS